MPPPQLAASRRDVPAKGAGTVARGKAISTGQTREQGDHLFKHQTYSNPSIQTNLYFKTDSYSANSLEPALPPHHCLPESCVLSNTAVSDLQSPATAIANQKYLNIICSNCDRSSRNVMNSLFFREGCGKPSPLPPLVMKHKSCNKSSQSL